MKRKFCLMGVSIFLIASLLLSSCGDTEDLSSSDQDLSVLGTASADVENSDSSDALNKKIYLDTYEVRETENGNDVLLFTTEGFANLEELDAESFTCEMIKEIVDNTIELYQNNDTITFPFKEGSVYSQNKTDWALIANLSCPGDDSFDYVISESKDVINSYVEDNDFCKKNIQEKEIVFYTGKTPDKMDETDKCILREIIWLRLWYTIDSGCFGYQTFSGRHGGVYIIYITNEADNYNEKSKLVTINGEEVYYSKAGASPYFEGNINLFPEWLQILRSK